jgi:hypothetical protein
MIIEIINNIISFILILYILDEKIYKIINDKVYDIIEDIVKP